MEVSVLYHEYVCISLPMLFPALVAAVMNYRETVMASWGPRGNVHFGNPDIHGSWSAVQRKKKGMVRSFFSRSFRTGEFFPNY